MQKPNKIIFITGFMTSGKSSVLKKLKTKYRLTCIDLDRVIEKNENKKISEIFEIKGEKEFRKIENKELRYIVKKRPQVVALGGGALMLNANLKFIRKHGIVVWLKIKPSTVLKRLTAKEKRIRPLFRGMSTQNQLKTITRLMKIREVNYKKADVLINADKNNINQSTKIIYEKCKN